MLIGSTVGWLVLIVIAMMGGLYFFHNKAWIYMRRSTSSYRQSQKEADLIEMTEKEKLIIEIDEDESFDLDKTALEITVLKKNKLDETYNPDIDRTYSEIKPIKGKQKLPEDNLDPMTLINDDIDPSIFKAMFDRLIDQESHYKNTLVERNQLTKANTQKIINKVAKIKKYFRDSLGGLSDLKDFEDEIPLKLSPQQEMDRVLRGLVGKYFKDADVKTGDGKENLYQNIVNNQDLTQKDKKNLIMDFNANIQRIEEALENEKSKAHQILKNRLLERSTKRNQQRDGKILQLSNYEIDANVLYIKQNPELNEEYKLERQEIISNLEKELNNQVIGLREQLEKDLRRVRYKAESDNLIREYEETVKRLEANTENQKNLQQNKLAALLRSRKDKNYYIEFEEPQIVREGKSSVLIPSYFNANDEQKLENLENKHEEELKIFQEKQDIDISEALAIAEIEFNQQEIIDNAIESTTQDVNIDNLLMSQELTLALQASRQKDELETRKEARALKRAIKRSELKKKYDAEKHNLIKKQEEEIDNLRDHVAVSRFDEYMKRQMRPEDIVAKIKDMLDEKHETDLAVLGAKKLAILMEKQNLLLQSRLSQKAQEIADVHKAFSQKREKIENSERPVETKLSEFFMLDRKENDAIVSIDYEFITNLSKEQGELSMEIEADYRGKLLDLADKHFQDIVSILKRMRAANPGLLEIHIRQAQDEADAMKSKIQSEYDLKLKDLEKIQKEIEGLQEERQVEISELQKDLEETEAKKNKLVEMEKARQEMQRKQKEMIEEMKVRGITKEKNGRDYQNTSN